MEMEILKKLAYTLDKTVVVWSNCPMPFPRRLAPQVAETRSSIIDQIVAETIKYHE